MEEKCTGDSVYNKVDVQNSNYRGIKLMNHSMKIWENSTKKSIKDAMFALKMLMEKYREGQKE